MCSSAHFHLLLFGIPQERFALAERFDGHFNGDHRGAAVVRVARELVLATERVDEDAFEIAALLEGQADLLFAVIFRLEFFLEIAVPAQGRLAAQFHVAMCAVNALIAERQKQIPINLTVLNKVGGR
jgi:hypothetical protein